MSKYLYTMKVTQMACFKNVHGEDVLEQIVLDYHTEILSWCAVCLRLEEISYTKNEYKERINELSQDDCLGFKICPDGIQTIEYNIDLI